MTTTYPRECARCGQGKPPWFKYCPKCYAIVQTEQLQPNTCDEQDCNVVIDDDHYLCRTHWQQLRDGRISECPECGEYKPSSFPLCRRCNAQSANTPVRPQQAGRPQQAPAAPAASNTRRAYDHHDGEEDAKAKDKRYWFNRQDNGVCNYCGHHYPYDQLEMEHMIPRELGGPDHRRNMQLTCGACNRKKGTSTDIEFRQLNADLIPLDERTPPKRPVDPERLNRERREVVTVSRRRQGVGQQTTEELAPETRDAKEVDERVAIVVREGRAATIRENRKVGAQFRCRTSQRGSRRKHRFRGVSWEMVGKRTRVQPRRGP